MKRTVLYLVGVVGALTLTISCGGGGEINAAAETPAATVSEVAAKNVAAKEAVAEGPAEADGTAPTKLAPEVDVAKIETFKDFTESKRLSWARYTERKKQALGEYSKAKKAKFSEYTAFDLEELRKLRQANRTAYLAWIDAAKIQEDAQRVELERTVPEIALYKKTTSAKYEEYAAAEKEALSKFLKTDEAAYAVYSVEEAMAYKAHQDYQARQK